MCTHEGHAVIKLPDVSLNLQWSVGMEKRNYPWPHYDSSIIHNRSSAGLPGVGQDYMHDDFV